MREAALLLAAAALSARLEVRALPPPPELAPGVLRRLSTEAMRVGSPGDRLTIFLAASPAHAAAQPPRVLAGFAPGALVGAMRIDGTWTDYRGGRVPDGVYTLRYAVQPLLKEHAGVSAYRDFLLVVPAASDDGSDGDGSRWVAASRGVSSAAHPAVLELLPVTPSPGDRLEETPTGELVVVPARSPTGLVIRGQAGPSGF